MSDDLRYRSKLLPDTPPFETEEKAREFDKFVDIVRRLPRAELRVLVEKAEELRLRDRLKRS